MQNKRVQREEMRKQGGEAPRLERTMGQLSARVAPSGPETAGATSLLRRAPLLPAEAVSSCFRTETRLRGPSRPLLSHAGCNRADSSLRPSSPCCAGPDPAAGNGWQYRRRRLQPAGHPRLRPPRGGQAFGATRRGPALRAHRGARGGAEGGGPAVRGRVHGPLRDCRRLAVVDVAAFDAFLDCAAEAPAMPDRGHPAEGARRRDVARGGPGRPRGCPARGQERFCRSAFWISHRGWRRHSCRAVRPSRPARCRTLPPGRAACLGCGSLAR